MKGFRANKERYILSRLSGRSTILHVGCTNSPRTIERWNTGTLLHKAIYDHTHKLGARVVGIDIDDVALELLKQRMPDIELYNVDAHELSKYFGEQIFDLIVAGDVIEHLPNPGLFLESCRKVLSPKGQIIITTVNAYGAVRFLKSAVFHEAVHPEHTAYYSHKTLCKLLEMSGLTTISAGYYACEPVKRLSLNRCFGNIMEHMVCYFWPQWSEGLIVVASSSDALPIARSEVKQMAEH